MTLAQLQYALLLLARQQGGERAVAHAASETLQRWRAADKLHERAYEKALAAWQGTDANGLQAHVAPPLDRPQRTRQAVRRGVLTALALASFAITGGLSRRSANASRIISTAQGEVRTAYLRDGSRVDIGAMTTVRIVETAHLRQVFLASGDTRLSVTKDADRPFVVTSVFGRATVIGTEFSVSVSNAAMDVAVREGKVGVRAGHFAMGQGADRKGSTDLAAGDDDVLLTPGLAVVVDASGVGRVVPVAPSSVGAWRDGWLDFDREDLLHAVARWNRYANDIIRVRDQDRHALQGLRITGSFTFADEAAFLESLPKILPVRVSRHDGLAWITHSTHS